MNKNNALSKSVYLLAFLLLLSFFSFSQNNFKISGKVTDESGKPLQGVTVQVKSTATATATADDGTFSITAPSGRSTLVFTSVGFAEQEIAVSNRTTIDVAMVNASAALADVVVIGYSSIKKKDVTGAVASINQKDIRSRPVDNAVQAMQGKVAGVQVVTASSRPGASSYCQLWQ